MWGMLPVSPLLKDIIKETLFASSAESQVVDLAGRLLCTEVQSHCCILTFTPRTTSPVSQLPAQNTITAESGQDIVLPCQVSPDKTIRAVKWSRADLGDEYVLLYRDEQLDPENQHPSFQKRVDLQDRQMKNGDVSLVLKNVTTADDGSYNCNIFNGGTNSWEIINTVSLTVSGQTGGDTEDGSVGLIAGLLVSALLLVAAVVGFLVYRKHKRQKRDFN